MMILARKQRWYRGCGFGAVNSSRDTLAVCNATAFHAEPQFSKRSGKSSRLLYHLTPVCLALPCSALVLTMLVLCR